MNYRQQIQRRPHIRRKLKSCDDTEIINMLKPFAENRNKF